MCIVVLYNFIIVQVNDGGPKSATDRHNPFNGSPNFLCDETLVRISFLKVLELKP